MQAIVLAAGKSKRFYPYNTTSNKAFVKIFGKTILEHTLLSIKKTGIKEVIIVVPDIDLAKKSLSPDLGLELKFVELTKPLGMGEALLKAKDLIKGDFFLLHATHPDFHEFYELMLGKNKGDVLLLTRKETRTKKYGLVKVEGELVTDFTEKPSEDSDGLRVVGIYLLSKNFIEVLKEIPTEHYSFEVAIAKLCPDKKVFHVYTDKNAISLKYAWDLFGIKDYLLDKTDFYISPNAIISDLAIIEGKVVIEDGAKIMEGAVIKGGNYIGKNSAIGTNAILRGGSVIGEDCTIGASSEVKNTIMLDGSTIHSGFLGDSIVGNGSKIAALFCASNKRIDRDTIKVEIGSETLDTYTNALGVITGENVNIGARVTTMPGIIIGNNVTIGPGTNVMKNIPDNTKFYATFKENIEKTS